MTKDDWRSDEGWRLIEWSTSHWTSAPPDTPLPEAELAGDGAWSSVFVHHRPVATWFNPKRKIK